MAFYAVAKGYCPGIYNTWSECEKQVKGYSSAIFKRFNRKEEAENYLHQQSLTSCRKKQCDKSLYPKILNDTISNDIVTETISVVPPMARSDEVMIFTDGACQMLPNGKRRCGYGWYIPKYNRKVSKAMSGVHYTNNRAELMAIIDCVGEFPVGSWLHILTDSRYCLLIFGGTGRKYAANGYCDKTGVAVLNSDLVERAVSLLDTYHLRFTYVKAHTGLKDEMSRGNSIADELARTGALQSVIL